MRSNQPYTISKKEQLAIWASRIDSLTEDLRAFVEGPKVSKDEKPLIWGAIDNLGGAAFLLRGEKEK